MMLVLRKAQLGLFAGAKPAATGPKTTVKTYARKTKAGKVAIVHEHQRATKPSRSPYAESTEQYERLHGAVKTFSDALGDLGAALGGWGWRKRPVPPGTREALQAAGHALLPLMDLNFASESKKKALAKYLRRVQNAKKMVVALSGAKTDEELVATYEKLGSRSNNAWRKFSEYERELLLLVGEFDSEPAGQFQDHATRVAMIRVGRTGFTPVMVDKVQAVIQATRRALQARHMGHLLDDLTVFVYPTSGIPGRPSAVAWYRHGDDTAAIAAGSSWFGKRTPESMAQSMVHELGHRAYYQQMTPRGRQAWTDYFKTHQIDPGVDATIAAWEAFVADGGDAKEQRRRSHFRTFYEQLHKEDPEKATWLLMTVTNPGLHAGERYDSYHGNPTAASTPALAELKARRDTVKVFNEPVTGYSSTNEAELYAEAFAHYVMHGPRTLSPTLRNQLERTLPALRKGARRLIVLAKGLAAKGVAPGQPGLFGGPKTTVKAHVRRTNGKVAIVHEHQRAAAPAEAKAEAPALTARELFRLRAAELRGLVGAGGATAIAAQAELDRRAAKRAKKFETPTASTTTPDRDAAVPTTRPTKTRDTSFADWAKANDVDTTGLPNEFDAATLAGQTAFGGGQSAAQQDVPEVVGERPLNPDLESDRAFARAAVKRAARRAARAADPGVPPGGWTEADRVPVVVQARHAGRPGEAIPPPPVAPPPPEAPSWPLAPARFRDRYIRAEFNTLGHSLAETSSVAAVHKQIVSWQTAMEQDPTDLYTKTFARHASDDRATLTAYSRESVRGLQMAHWDTQQGHRFSVAAADAAEARTVAAVEAFANERIAPMTRYLASMLSFWRQPELYRPGAVDAQGLVDALQAWHRENPRHIFPGSERWIQNALEARGVPTELFPRWRSDDPDTHIDIYDLVQGKQTLDVVLAAREQADAARQTAQRASNRQLFREWESLHQVVKAIEADGQVVTTGALNKRLPKGVRLRFEEWGAQSWSNMGKRVQAYVEGFGDFRLYGPQVQGGRRDALEALTAEMAQNTAIPKGLRHLRPQEARRQAKTA